MIEREKGVRCENCRETIIRINPMTHQDTFENIILLTITVLLLWIAFDPRMELPSIAPRLRELERIMEEEVMRCRRAPDEPKNECTCFAPCDTTRNFALETLTRIGDITYTMAHKEEREAPKPPPLPPFTLQPPPLQQENCNT